MEVEIGKILKGNISYMEKELGIMPGAWEGKTLARIDVPNPRDLNIRIPSGNELGANNNWIPGGKLPNHKFSEFYAIEKKFFFWE